MEEFIYNTKIVLGTLGHKFLEPINSRDSNSDQASDSNTLIGKILYFTVNGLSSQGKLSDEGFILIKGSEISINITQSIPTKINELRNKLLAEKTLIENSSKLILTKDIILSSPSYSAAFVAGTSRSGPQSWKDINGNTLKSLEESLIKS